VSLTPCAAMNFGLSHGSWCPVPNVKCVTLGPNLPWRCKKGRIFEIFRLECQIFEGVTPKFVGCQSAKSVFWVTGHNPCRIEWNCTVIVVVGIHGKHLIAEPGVTTSCAGFIWGIGHLIRWVSSGRWYPGTIKNLHCEGWLHFWVRLVAVP
jgi:hypothetical protein